MARRVAVRVGELAERAGTTVRTVRYYVAERLLPPPVGGGRQAVYTYEHLVRLGAIRALKASYLPLAEIRRRLDAMPLEEMEALLAAPDEPETVLDAVGRPLVGMPGPAARPSSAGSKTPVVPAAARRPAAVASPAAFALPSAHRRLAVGTATSAGAPLPNFWQRVVLAPGVELSFTPTNDPGRTRAIAELIEHATAYLAASSSRASEAR
jgi:DNA-binding transcriptional MerR regulator